MPTTTTTSGLSLRQLAQGDERVFPSYPQVARYFPSASIEDARTRLCRAIDRGDGPGLVIGGPGTGKSLLLQVLASQYHDRFDVVLPACARLCTRRALLQSILFELGLTYRLRDEGDLRLSLLDHLLSREDCPTGLLLLIDEAHTLSIALLDELRVLTNLVCAGMPRVRLVLAGSSALEECFAHPELESFSQRLSARCYLAPFGREESAQFVRAQISASGSSADNIFASNSWEAIFEATDGVPRLVNQLCDRALVEANAAGRTRIDRQTIQAVWADIQQLPTPWDTPAPETASTAAHQIIEFGNLSDDRADESVSMNGLVVEESFEDDQIPSGDLTELDIDDDCIAAEQSRATPPVELTPSIANSSDPFAERFDEEEVVLDNFAAWDEMFRRTAPLVQNRRDPEFAALVEAAITVNVAELEIDQFDAFGLELPIRAPSKRAETKDRPTLRLAVVSDSSPVATPFQLALAEASRAPAARVSHRVDQSRTVSSRETLDACDEAINHLNEADQVPVLIIEDESTPVKSPVRREQYRHLFSQLRSG